MHPHLDAGDLRHRLEIQRATEANNAFGESLQTWSTLTTRWGAIDDQAGTELRHAQRVNAQVTAVVKLRPYDGLTAKDRFKHGTRILNILAITEGNRTDRLMTCWCKEER